MSHILHACKNIGKYQHHNIIIGLKVPVSDVSSSIELSSSLTDVEADASDSIELSSSLTDVEADTGEAGKGGATFATVKIQRIILLNILLDTIVLIT